MFIRVYGFQQCGLNPPHIFQKKYFFRRKFQSRQEDQIIKNMQHTKPSLMFLTQGNRHSNLYEFNIHMTTLIMRSLQTTAKCYKRLIMADGHNISIQVQEVFKTPMSSNLS